MLTRRLRRLAQIYEHDFGVDVTAMAGAGAAGGLAGGLAARGASLVDGFELVADEIDLGERILNAEVVVTGEGRYDATSLQGKVVGEWRSWPRRPVCRPSPLWEARTREYRARRPRGRRPDGPLRLGSGQS